MRLDPAAFNRLLRNIGQDVAWRRAFDCPCRDPYSGAADPACPMCRGRGSIWGDPVTGYAGVQSMTAKKEWANFDLWESGDMVVTIPGDSPIYAAGQFDQIILSQSSEPFSLVFRRGEDDTFQWPVVSIDRVFSLNQSRTDVVEWQIPTVTEAGALSWDAGLPLPEYGQQFSISGRRRPVFFLFKDLPRDRSHHAGQPLPRRVVVRTFDLFGRGMMAG